MQTETSITIYNKYGPSSNPSYKKTVIKNATWRDHVLETISTTQTSSGILNVAKDIKIRVPIFNNNFQNKTYIDPKLWSKSSLDTTRDNYFTIQENDYVVKGECDYDFSSTNPITNLTNNYADVVSIISKKVNNYGSKVLQHFFIGGK